MSDWKETLAAVAPALATALGGPLAGAAASVIGGHLMGDSKATMVNIANAIAGASPEELLKLQVADKQFALDAKKLDVEDRKGARNLAINTTIMPQVTLSIIYTVGYFYLIIGLGSGEINIPESVTQPFNILLGIMTAAQAQIMNFWFGSSSGSKEKTSKLR